MKNKSITLFLSIIFIFLMQSCKKNNETPEVSDPIYIGLLQELDISIKQEADLKNQLAKDMQQFKSTVPQSGMYTINRNKMSTSENMLNIIQQQKKFFEIKIEQRKIEVRNRYQESLQKNGRPWPDQKEIEDYKIRMKLQRDKFQWDSKNVPRGTNDKKEKTKNTKTAPTPTEHKSEH